MKSNCLVWGVFCDPQTYASPDQLNQASQGVVPILGIHPKRNISETEFQQLAALLDRPEVAELGEVGIDRTEPSGPWAAQLMKSE